MRLLKLTLLLNITAGLAANAGPLTAQESFLDRFASHNSSMSSLQPSFITPLVAPDPRLLQYARASFSREYAASGTETVNFGNGKGGGVIAGNRFEFDFIPPAYIEHNSTAKDGFGDTTALAKFRIASGDAEHGNFALSAILNHCFPTGSYKNGAATGSWGPTLTGGLAFRRRFDVISSLGGTLPTGKVDAQGRSVAWNELAQFHATKHMWFEVENNSTFYFAGEHDGKMQNFVTPGAYYVVRRKAWKPTHPFFIIDSGMQMATSEFHTYNHNLISEARILF
jgi:hypothetical protein